MSEPAADARAAPDPGAPLPPLELRVHGVSGTSPADLLDRPLVEQVSGDRIAGFYRPRLVDERLDERAQVLSPPRPGAPQLEGYSWGGLTSRSPGRALWLVLLPFTLVNVAPRARPPSGTRTAWLAPAIWYLCRLLALVLTMLFVLAAAGVGEDLVGWQCAGDTDRCADAKPRALFERLITGHHLSAEHTLLISAVVPLLVLGVLWRVSTRTANRYERTVSDLTGYQADADDDAPGSPELPLSSRSMWRNEWPVRRLRAVHLQCGFAMIEWTMAAPTRGRWTGVLGAVVAVYALVVLALPSFSRRSASRPWQRASAAVWLLVVAVGVVQFVGYLTVSPWLVGDFLTRSPRGRLPTGALPYFGLTVLVESTVLAGLLVLLIVAVAAAALGRNRAAPPAPHESLRPGLVGASTAALAALGAVLAAAFSAGVYTYAAAYLYTGSVKPGFGEVSLIYQFFVVPDAVRSASQAYAWAVMVLAALLVVGLLGGLACYVGRPQVLGSRGAIEHDYGADATEPERRKGIRQAIFLGRLVDLAPWAVGPLTAAVTAIGLGFGVQALVVDQRDRLAGVGPPPGFFSTDSLRGAGAYFAVLTLLGLVAVGSIAFRAPGTRRTVGILWDVASFWPRLGHPLAAPCYAERTVPDLVTRITSYRVGDPRRPVVLAAHSQGSVISAAALAQLATYDAAPRRVTSYRVLDGVGFLTFGCVLRRLYGRYFPVYFGPARLAEVQDMLTVSTENPRWRNLWRYTDYLGGQVTAGPPPVVPPGHSPLIKVGELRTTPPVRGPQPWEWHSPDPPLFARAPGDTVFTAPARHSDYWSDRSGYFQLAAVELAELIRSEDPARAAPPAIPP